jgi:glycosyltransferase involved in cell wall biosynthesis
MKILCVIDSLGCGGAQRQLVELAKGFKESGNDVAFLVYHHIPFYLDDVKRYSIDYTCMEEPNYFKRFFKMRKHIRTGNYDVVLSFLEASSFICELSGFPYRKWKLIVGERSANPNILKSKKRKLYRWFHLLADYVVANSNENIKIIERINPFLSKNKCKVIYNLIDTNIWKPVDDYIPLKNEKLNIVVAASHQYLKNAKGLILALNLLSEENKKKITVNWYGSQSPDNSFIESRTLIEQYNLTDIITFHKATNSITDKMQYADVIGLFSFYEGLPNVICEAMMLGKPVISSSVSDIPAILSSDFIFNPHDTKDIAKSLSLLLSFPISKFIEIGKNNRKTALSLFDKSIIMSEYLNLLK